MPWNFEKNPCWLYTHKCFHIHTSRNPILVRKLEQPTKRRKLYTFKSCKRFPHSTWSRSPRKFPRLLLVAKQLLIFQYQIWLFIVSGIGNKKVQFGVLWKFLLFDANCCRNVLPCSKRNFRTSTCNVNRKLGIGFFQSFQLFYWA